MVKKQIDSIDPRIDSVTSTTPDGREHALRWSEWGDPGNPRVVICAHGLSRNGRDFDFLARELAASYRVICPDYPGRGTSDWFHDPSHYHNFQYLDDTLRLIENLDFEVLDWVGTSMGGLIGMGLASRPDNPLRRMVINDVGPFIPGEALALIGEYLGTHPFFPDLETAENYFRQVYASFGPLDDHHYAHFVKYGVRPKPEETGYVLELDPAVIDQFVALPTDDIALWEYWDAIEIPTLVIRGEKSGLLLPEVVEEMLARHSGAESTEITGCAHAPSLMTSDQIQLVSRWLSKGTQLLEKPNGAE